MMAQTNSLSQLSTINFFFFDIFCSSKYLHQLSGSMIISWYQWFSHYFSHVIWILNPRGVAICIHGSTTHKSSDTSLFLHSFTVDNSLYIMEEKKGSFLFLLWMAQMFSNLQRLQWSLAWALHCFLIWPFFISLIPVLTAQYVIPSTATSYFTLLSFLLLISVHVAQCVIHLQMLFTNT